MLQEEDQSKAVQSRDSVCLLPDAPQVTVQKGHLSTDPEVVQQYTHRFLAFVSPLDVR